MFLFCILCVAFEIQTNRKCQGIPFSMSHSRERAPRAAVLVYTLKDIKGSCRYIIELFSSSLYSSNHDTTHNFHLLPKFKILPRFYSVCLYSSLMSLTQEI